MLGSKVTAIAVWIVFKDIVRRRTGNSAVSQFGIKKLGKPNGSV